MCIYIYDKSRNTYNFKTTGFPQFSFGWFPAIEVENAQRNP